MSVSEIRLTPVPLKSWENTVRKSRVESLPGPTCLIPCRLTGSWFCWRLDQRFRQQVVFIGCIGFVVMKKNLQKSRDALRSNVLLVAEACPVEGCHPMECPLHSFRLLGTAARWEWVDALKEDELSYISAYCHVCFDMKQKREPPRAVRSVRDELERFHG